MRHALVACTIFAMCIALGCEPARTTTTTASRVRHSAVVTTDPADKVTRTDAQWRELLTLDQYNILRQKGTEPPFDNAYWNNHSPGIYVCAGCGLTLFSSDAKFESGTGWPSFYQPIAPGHVAQSTDADGERTELTCPRCGGHLGHVFDDGPKPTGLRFCIDSAALKFVPAAQPTK